MLSPGRWRRTPSIGRRSGSFFFGGMRLCGMGLSEVTGRSAHCSAPKVSNIVVVAVTTSSQSLQINVAGQLGVGFANTPRIITLKADGGKVWFFFSSSAVNTVDETVTAAADASRCFSIDDGERQDWEWDYEIGFTGNLYIYTKAAAACKLRIALTSPDGGGG